MPASLLNSLRKPLTAFAARTPSRPTSDACLNCGTALTGPFCAQCGQRDVPPYPSVRELVTDAFWELSGWDGRFAGTVRALVTKPGRLTIDFPEGRRVRFISPLRLYLLASLLFFLVSALAPELQKARAGTFTAPGISIGLGGPSTVAKAEANARQGTLTQAERDSAMADIAHAPRVLRPILTRALTDQANFRRDVFEAMPRMLFALVPVFAALLALFYRRRKYPEHLYFGLHFHAFVFVALTLAALSRFTHSLVAVGVAQAIVGIWIAVYGILSLKHVYGGSTISNMTKAAIVAALYSIVGLLGILGTVFWINRALY